LDPSLDDADGLPSSIDETVTSSAGRTGKIKIIDSPVPNENTCMFYAMYNSLRTNEEKIAFSDGNLKHPSKAFVDFHINTTTPETTRTRMINEGYNADDMRKYLIELVARKRIREYDWIFRKNWSFSTFFCGGVKNQPPGSWLLFGLNVLSTERKAARNRLKVAGEGEHPSFVALAQCQESLAFMEDFCVAMPKYLKWQHGGVIQRDDQGNTYYYDTAKRFVVNSPTVTSMTEIITGICLVVEFKLYLHGDPSHRKKRKKENRRRNKKKRMLAEEDKEELFEL
jgi:hypothetical protein